VEPAAAASASDNLVDAWRTVGPLIEARRGAEVLIVSGGALSIALYAVEFAVALGAGRVAYLDSDPERLALAWRWRLRSAPRPSRARRPSAPATST
jgi:alcohol dehydrogenase